jgi:hypothetical protein
VVEHTGCALSIFFCVREKNRAGSYPRERCSNPREYRPEENKPIGAESVIAIQSSSIRNSAYGTKLIRKPVSHVFIALLFNELAKSAYFGVMRFAKAAAK